MVTIVLAASKECEAELEKMGFKQETVWTHRGLATGVTDAERKASGDHAMFSMPPGKRPFMFVTTSWWGMGPD